LEPPDPPTRDPAWHPGRTARASAGSISIEAVLVIPAFVLFLVLIIAIGRVAMVREDLGAAAVNGTRIASLTTGSAAAETAAREAVTAQLAREGTTCLTLDIGVDTTALDRPPGEPGTVTTTIGCDVPLADLLVPGLPGHWVIRASYSTPIDTYTNR
jgi:Flp pilus assembly protein TadG